MSAEMVLFAGFLLLWAVLFFGVWFVNAARSRNRAEALRPWALQNNFQFDAAQIKAHELAPMQFLGAGRWRRTRWARNVLRRGPLTTFDLQRAPGKRHRNPGFNAHEGTYALFRLEQPLPTFAFFVLALDARQSSRVFDVMRMMAGSNAFALDGYPGTVVQSNDRESVSGLFANGPASTLADKTGWIVAAEDHSLLVYAPMIGPFLTKTQWAPTPYIRPQDYGAFVATAESIRDSFVKAQA